MKKVVSLFVMIAALLLSPQQVKADRIKESCYYKVVEDETGADHFTAKILMADLLYGDTYVKEGKLVAYERNYRKGKRIEICELHTWDQDGNDQPVHFIKGRNLMEGACIFISNAFNQMLQAEEKDYVINKKSNFDLPQVFLEVYWGPEMANREWFIYFELKDEDDDEHSHRMGSVNCGEYVNMGRNALKVNQYKIERTGPLKFRFTTPPLPDNNCRDELKSYQQHQAWYILKSTYTLQDNKTVISKRDSVACLPSAEVPHMLNIPASAGNFKRMHLELEVHDAYKSVKDGFKDAKNKGYFYDNVISITPTTKLLSVPYPSDVTGKYDQYGRKIELSWTGLDKSSTESNDNGYFKETKPYIYRIETNAAGTVLNGAKWVYRGKLSTHATESTMNFTDNEGIQYNRYYKYMVVNIPDVWTQELNPTNIKEDVLNVLGSSIMNNAISTKPTMSFKSLIQDKTEKTKVKLKWQYDRVPTTSGTVHFSVLRANTGKNNWAEIGTVGATSNPSPDFFATFTDEAVENIDTRHEYKVKLTLQDGNEWESDIINAGLLAGTSIDTLIASQGNYEHSVMLRWTAKQSGTEDTRYRVLRRIAGGDNEAYNVIYTTSGTSSTYIFEDRTVSPGFLYDYLLHAYHGELSDDKKPMSEFTAVGFCQTTGIITGRISFKNGDNGVENVRVTLDAQDNNASSKQVVGPSNGIVWKADRIATANMFRKANTVQMLVRPESSMAKGVLASVPGMGHFLLEKDADAADSKTFKLQMKSERANTYKVATCYTEKPLVRAVLAHYNYYQHTTSSAYIDGHTYTVYNYDDIMNDYWDLTRQWKEEGFTEVFQFNTYGLGHGEIVIVFFVKKQPVTDHSLIKSYHTMHGREKYDLGITLPADEFSLLNLMKDDQGHLTVKVGEQTSTSKTSVGVESTSNSSEETTALNRVPFDVDPASLIDEAYLKSDDGTVLLDQWRNLEKVLATEVVSIPEGNDVYDDFSLPFAVGGSYDVTTETAFYGNLSEVRVWDHVLSTQEETDNNDRILSGSEQGLRIYWPLSEFSDQIALDASCTNDVPNVRNGSVGTNIKVSPLVPEAAKMSRYVLTNARGEYTIRNVPFAGTDTRYTVTPSYGIHAFSPASRSAVISASSLVFGNYNFNDMSSFIVTGKVTYKNTNIPVDSVMFKVDGQVMTDAHGIIYSNSEGKYRISVSNGNHRIEAYRDGHLLSAFPMEKENTYEFRKDETVDFIDSTLVNVTGRINGGFTDKDEPLGFGRSKNRIGQAEIVLSLGREAMSSFNYIINDRGEGSFGIKPIAVSSATPNINSTAYRGAGTESDNTDTHYIYIKTDSLTGEFSAMLPPLRYKVERIRFPKDAQDDSAIYNNMDFFTQNLPMIDATNAVERKMQADTLKSDGNSRTYSYAAKFVRQLRNEAIIDVTQQGKKNGAFGLDTLRVTDEVDSRLLTLTQYSGDGFSYTYGYPIFQQGSNCDMTISVRERYLNVDTRQLSEEIPQDAILHINNEGSSSAMIAATAFSSNGQDFKPGQLFKARNVTAPLGTSGTVDYSWSAGYPNTENDFLRNLTISTQVDGRTTMWKAPNKRGDSNALQMIVLGSILTGENFVTAAPDHVDMILRRPPGSTSYASLTNDTVYATSHIKYSYTDNATGGGNYASLGRKKKTNLHPFGYALLSVNFQTVANEEVTRVDINDKKSQEEESNTYTVSEALKTPTSGNYIQNGGDTFIGRSTNILFGSGKRLALIRQSDGSYPLQVKETVCMGEEFSTTFVYAQKYVEDVLIPNWEQMIDNLLTVVDDPQDPNQAIRIEGKAMYYTKYPKGHPRHGLSNDDPSFTQEERNACKGKPSFRLIDGRPPQKDQDNYTHATDSVEWCINQIKQWRDWIAKNEQDKIIAFGDKKYFEDNYSIAGGTSISHTAKTRESRLVSHTTTSSHVFNSDNHAGALVLTYGDYAIIKGKKSWGDTDINDTTVTRTQTVNWVLSDAEPTTALSVDVYKSPSGWGPVFRTRGGQTSNPYEPATYTQYYAPGNLLDEATMRVEKPELRVKGASEVTDILSGTSASFVLQLHNASETNTVCDYVLECKDGSNPNGAILMMDGAPLSNGKDGRKFKLKGGETIEKTLQVSQSDRSIVDYMNLKLVLKSATDTATVSAPVELSIHFIPASTPVELSVNSSSLIGRDYNAGGLQVTLRQLDRSDKDLTGVRVQYRRKGTMSWTLHKEWQVERPGKTLPSGVSPLPDTEQISTLVKFPEDGIYELRAQTFGLYGTKELTFETPSVDITQDIRGPKILGSSTPQGTATYLDRNNISVRFNEPIYDVSLSQSDNFTITGDLCNTAASGVKTTNPDVTLQLAGNEISTQSAFQFNNSDVAIDLWLYRQSDGDIVSIGTDANQLSLSTNSGKAEFRLGNADEVIASAVELPSNKWLYIALSYRQDPASERGLLSALYADADTPAPVSILKDTPVPSLPIKGKLTVGGTGTVGRMRDLTLWNTSKDVHQLYRERELSKAPYTPGLVGYWRMNEGHGTTLNDKARSRNMEMKGESWYINNENRAVRLASEDSLAVDISTFSPRSTDSYALELWFRAVRQEGNSNASLIEVPNCLCVGFDDSRLTLKTYKRSNSEENAETVTLQSAEVLSERNYADNEWHHLALNVRRGVSAVAYIDGAAVKTLAESSIPAPASPELYVGKGLTGGIDDVRIWSASLDAKAIAERRYERLDSTYSGLIGYFPFEDIHRTPTGTVTSSFSMRNFGDTSASHLTASGISAEHHASATAPALLPVSQRMRLHETEYAFTASEREIYFSLPDAILPKMDGSDFTFRLSNIKDKYGNVSEPVEWTLHCDFSTLSLTLDETEIVKGRDEQRTFTATLKSLSGADEDYEFVNLPSWLEVSESIGKVGKSGKTISFTLPANIRIGHYTVDIFVQDRLNIKRSCRLHLVVKGFEPEWSVDERLYASNMVVTGQVYVGNKILEYEDSKIGAFDEQGNCIGVAHPEYIRTRDAYYVSMVVYGNPDDKPMTSEERHVYFRLYDSSTGTTYPRVSFLLPEENAARMQFDFTADATYGSYDCPVIFAPTDEIQQIKDLNKGWNWMSVYLTSKEGPQIPVNTVFKTVLPYVDEVKDHNFFAVPKKDRSAIDGSLKYVTAGKMYKVRMNNAGTLSLVGLLVNVENTSQTIQPEWNWMGSLTSYVMSPDVAFADLNPEKGDMVKNRTSFAEYNGYTWEGQLQEIKPGEGYLYHSRASQAKTFHYPKQVTTASAHARRAAVLMANDNEEWHWTVENINHYPDNMTILATLEKDGKLIDNAEVAAFINGECRGNIKGVDGHYFLTVLGISAEDTRKHVALKAWIGGTEYDIDDMGFNFLSDASYGSFADGLVNLAIGGDTGINSVTDCDDNAEWYDLQGRKLNGKPTKVGVFIRNRNKEVVK